MPTSHDAEKEQELLSLPSHTAHTTKFLPPLALRSLISRDGLGVYASSDTLYKGAVFGRDSLEVCEDLLAIRPVLVRRSLLTLASLQGEVTDRTREEEPGKILHEYRRQVVDGKPIAGKQREIFDTLSRKWGGSADEMLYFGSVDATPHFIRTIGAYCDRYPEQAKVFLQTEVVLRSGIKLPLHTVVEKAVGWLLLHLEKSRSGFVEYCRRNPEGLLNQAWKDSDEFYVHETGELANHAAPISSIEVQGLAYDALQAAAKLFPANQKEYLEIAAALRQKVFEVLWQADREYFALGTDFSESGSLRIIRTLTANPAGLLDSRLFDDLPQSLRAAYIIGLVTRIMSQDFLTDAGIRSRALSEGQLIKFKDYHGSYVSWPKETYDIAKGLRRQGFIELARELENRLLNVCHRNLDYPEFLYVDEQGRVLPTRPVNRKHGGIMVVNGVNKPEVVQAWTVSAVLAIVAQRSADQAKLAIASKPASQQGSTSMPPPKRWQSAVEQAVLASMPHIKQLDSPAALRARYPQYDFRLER